MKKKEIYKCSECADYVEVIGTGGCECEINCCGKPMKLMDEKTKDGAGEKHMPVVEEKDGGIFVKVGEVPHPMEKDHYIMVIEVITKDGYVIRKELNPGEAAEAGFNVAASNVESVREVCNKHGVWAKQ